MSSESALVKPFRSVYNVVGALFDAVYYFFSSLISPGSNGRLNSRSNRSGGTGGSGWSGGSGPRIATLRHDRGNAPNMNVGCRSCQM